MSRSLSPADWSVFSSAGSAAESLAYVSERVLLCSSWRRFSSAATRAWICSSRVLARVESLCVDVSHVPRLQSSHRQRFVPDLSGGHRRGWGATHLGAGLQGVDQVLGEADGSVAGRVSMRVAPLAAWRGQCTWSRRATTPVWSWRLRRP